MATAEEVLNGMEEEDGEQKRYLVIDNQLRTIAIPDEVKILGVESDEEVNRLHFKMPKKYGEFDLSEFALRVNYMNANNEPDLYEVTDNAANGEFIEFSWLAGRKATEFKGEVKFIVCAKKLDESGAVTKEFNTTLARLTVLEGLETGKAVAQMHPDIIEAILLRLNKLEHSGGVSDEQIANAVEAYLQENPIQSGATEEQAAQIQANKEAIEELQKGGADGEDGGYYTPTVSENGILSWTASKDGMPDVQPTNVKGADGEDGYTPVRGTDYWTTEDIAQIKGYVDEAILGGEW